MILESDPQDWRLRYQKGESWWYEDLGAAIKDLGVGKRKYGLRLEVRIPGEEPFEIAGKFKVPTKAEKTGKLSSDYLHAGLELPVRVDPGDRTRVEIDWERFLARPDRHAAVGEAKQDRRHEVYRQELAKKPKLAAKMREGNRQAVRAWAAAVEAGTMSREEFEQTVNEEVKTGRMDPADAEAARKTLDG